MTVTPRNPQVIWERSSFLESVVHPAHDLHVYRTISEPTPSFPRCRQPLQPILVEIATDIVPFQELSSATKQGSFGEEIGTCSHAHIRHWSSNSSLPLLPASFRKPARAAATYLYYHNSLLRSTEYTTKRKATIPYLNPEVAWTTSAFIDRRYCLCLPCRQYPAALGRIPRSDR